MVVVRITMNVLPEKQLEVTQTLLSMIELTGKETGYRCIPLAGKMEQASCGRKCGKPHG